MQRYGWQARQSRNSQSANESLTNQTVQSNTTEGQVKGNDNKVSSTLISKNSSMSSAQGLRQPKITRVSSIDPNPLFQGMDIVPQRRTGTVREPAKNNDNDRNRIQRNQKPDELNVHMNKNEQKIQTSIPTNPSPYVTRPRAKTNTEVNAEQVIGLRFQKTQKMSQSIMLQKQSLTQRPKKVQLESQSLQKSQNQLRFEQKTDKKEQVKAANVVNRRLTTQRKKYDLVDDILFPNQRYEPRKAATLNQTTSKTLQSQMSINPVNQSVQNQKNKQIQIQRQNSKQSNNLQKTVVKSRQKQVSSVVKDEVIKNKRSNIVLYCLNKLSKSKKLENFLFFSNQLKNRKAEYEKYCIGVLRLIRLFQHKQMNWKVYSFSKINKFGIQRPLQNNNIKGSSLASMLIYSINSLFLSRKRQTFSKVKSYLTNIYQNKLTLDKFIKFHIRKAQKQGFRKIKIFGQIRAHQKQDCVKKLFFVINNIKKNLQFISFKKILESNVVSKISNQQDDVSIDNKELFQSPKGIKNQAVSAPNITSFSDPSKKKKQEIKPAVRNTAKAANNAELKLQKQMEEVQKNYDEQISASQLRIQQLKQINSEYNFQISFKKEKYKQINAVLKQYESTGQNKDEGEQKVEKCLRLCQLAQIYFKILYKNGKYSLPEANNKISIRQLSQMIDQPLQNLNADVEKWFILYQNLQIKSEVQKYEGNLNGREVSESSEWKKRSGWQQADHEYQTLIELLRNYVKQQYYWTGLMTKVSKKQHF